VTDIRPFRNALVERILDGDGQAPASERRAAFQNNGLAGPLGMLAGKVATRPGHITDKNIAALTTSGLSEDQLFEIIVCASVGQATRQYEAAFAALEAATGKE